MMKLQVKLMGHARIPTLSAEEEEALRKSGANRVAESGNREPQVVGQGCPPGAGCAGGGGRTRCGGD